MLSKKNWNLFCQNKNNLFEINLKTRKIKNIHLLSFLSIYFISLFCNIYYAIHKNNANKTQILYFYQQLYVIHRSRLSPKKYTFLQFSQGGNIMKFV